MFLAVPGMLLGVGAASLAPLAESVKARRLELGLSVDAAAASVRMSSTTWTRVESALPVRDLSYAGVDRALGWEVGSCEAIIAGGAPTPRTSPPEGLATPLTTPLVTVPEWTSAIVTLPTGQYAVVVESIEEAEVLDAVATAMRERRLGLSAGGTITGARPIREAIEYWNNGPGAVTPRTPLRPVQDGERLAAANRDPRAPKPGEQEAPDAP